MTVQHDIIGSINSALAQLDLPELDHVQLEHPANPEHGDYSTNVAMQLFGKLKKEQGKSFKETPWLKQVDDHYEGDLSYQLQYHNPRELAQALADKMNASINADSPVSKVEVAGPGFINFYLADTFFVRQLHTFTGLATNYLPNLGQGKTFVAEYSSPNIAKPFTVGHLRSTIIGAAIANILEATGWDVRRDNHLGDWGTQFGKQIYALMHLGEGSLEKNIEKINNSPNPVKELVALYVEFHAQAEADPTLEEEGRAWFKKLEDGDTQARKLWQMCIEWSLQEFNRIYQRLGVQFTENGGTGYGESFFEDKMQPVIQELEEKGLLQESKGAKVVFYPNDKYPPFMILKSDGATLYATRDLATDKFRLEHYGRDVIVMNETGHEQTSYWQQLFELEKMLGWYKEGQRKYVVHGHYRFADKKMSTRKGNVIWLEEVLDEAVKKAAELAGDQANEVSEMVGIGALKWNDLKQDPLHEIVFDWDQILNLKGNSGPYIQYTHARCRSILEKAGGVKDGMPVDISLAKDEKNVLRVLYQFPEVVQKAAEEFAPHHVAVYLFELAQAYNTFYTNCPVLTAETEEIKTFRLQLTQATANILKVGLRLLGIEAPVKM